MLETGQRIDDRYEVEALIGQGGLAEVYRVRHVELGSVHALKLLLFRKKSLAQRLLLEGRIQAQLRHPNVVAVTDVVRHEGQFGLLMEYVDNVGLDALIEQRGALPVEEALELLAPILAGVQAAHRAGVLHRDLKPANVLLARTRGGGVVPKVSDFGIAKVVDDSLDGSTREGVAMGTPGYMAPEQVLDARSVDVRTDVFALAAIFYELVSGRRAFADERGEVTVRSTLEGTFLPLHELVEGVDRHLSDVVGRALSREREERYPDVAAFARELLVDRPDLMAMVEGSAVARPISLDPTQPSLFTDPGKSVGVDVGQGPTILPPPTAMTYEAGEVAAASLDSQPGPITVEPARRRRPPPFWTAVGLAAGLLAVGAGLGVLVAGPGLGFSQTGVPRGEPPRITSSDPVGSVAVVTPDVRPDAGGEAARPGDGAGGIDLDEGASSAAGAGTSQSAAQPPPPEPPASAGSVGEAAVDGASDVALGGTVEGAVDAAGPGDGSDAVDAGAAAGAEPEPGTQPEPAGTADESAPAAAAGAATTPAPPPIVMPMDTFLATSWDGKVFRQPFTLRLLRERSGEVWAEGRIVLGASQRILPMVGRFDPATGRLFLRESNGDLILEGTVSEGRIIGTYRRSGKDRSEEPLDLTRR